MLVSVPTKSAAGVKFYGDYMDLQSLYETISFLEKGSPLDKNSHLGDFLLGLAYEIRHAYQGDRDVKVFGNADNGKTRYFGFKVLWPHILPQVGLLRWSASFHPTNHEHQSNLFRIEHCLKKALYEIDYETGRLVYDWLAIFPGWSGVYYTQFIDQCAMFYVTQAKSKKARFKKLPKVLYMMTPWGEHYLKYAAELEKIAKEKGCSPHDLLVGEEWPDFRW